jgi:primary-amine oxidase
MLNRLFSFFVVVFLWASAAQAQMMKINHPLDALTPEEIARAADILKQSKAANEQTLFPTIELLEPPKEFVLSWTAGKPIPRSALVIAREPGRTFEARVDLLSGKFEIAQKPDANPTILNAEWERAQAATMNDPRFIEAMKRRGYANPGDVLCTPNSAGFFPDEKYRGRRMLKVPCFDLSKTLHPTIARPIEGVMATVDSETGEVVDVIDSGIVPLPDININVTRGPALKPIGVILPEGPNVKITGNVEVEWLNWSFHLRADKRAGLIVSRVQFADGPNKRDVAYQMNVSEMFVPYMDPDPTWDYRTFIDAGEFGLGALISPLEPDVDCPGHASFIDMVLPNEKGTAYVAPSMVCIFERLSGDPAWRHYASGPGKVDGRQQLELVVRHIPTVGNYDYVIDYVFSPQGNITTRVGATGFDALKSVRSKTMTDATATTDTAYGALVAPYVVAPYHDHYINFRLDLDIDGTANTLVSDSFVPQKPTVQSLRKSLWKLQSEPWATEGAARSPHGGHGNNWRVSNMAKINILGQNPSYWIQGGHQATSILADDDAPQARAQFAKETLWVTRQKADEKWAAGTYANVSTTDTGLPVFSKDQDSVTNEDLVLWFTMGFRHATRPEDLPILPTFWHEMTLRPAFFFDKDPSSSFNPTALPEN